MPTDQPRTREAGPLRAARLALLALLAALPLSACGGGAPSPPVQTRASPVLHAAGGARARIAVIVMENEEYQDVIGSPQTPYISALAKRSGLARRMYAVAHPSLPNYLALTGGATFGISDDCTDCSVPGAGLAGQLDRGRIPWRAYLEGMPSPCWTGDGQQAYAKKHNPFVYFRSFVAGRAGCSSHDVPLSSLAADLRSGPPRFLWITPDLCHDMHDCDPGVGDRFLSHLVPSLVRALGPDGLLMLTWDEGTSDDGCCRLAHGGHVALIVAGGGARAGASMTTAVDHYSVLQTIEDTFGLPRLGGAACACTPSLAPLLRRWR